MHSESIIDQLETEFGTAILSDLTGKRLTRNGQSVRLFDQTKHPSEVFYKTGDKGKPYIQNFQEGTRLYPFTAYCKAYGVDAATAIEQLRYQYAIEAPTTTAMVTPRRRVPMPEPVQEPITFIPAEVYEPCRSRFERNGLFVYLSSYFDEPTARRIFDRYRLGTSRRWLYAGALSTALPQFDVAGNLRQVKIIAFHPQTGRRAKKDDYAERWNKRTKQYEKETEGKVGFNGHELAGYDKPKPKQCYVGEHLLTDLTKPVALVEGESTAFTMSEIWPEYHWLATGGATGGNWDDPVKFAVFKGRKVVLFPDSGKFEEWSHRVEKLRGIAAELTVSRYVEDNAPDINLDLRDLLTWPQWRKDSKTTYGQILPLTAADGYPASVDEPGVPGAVSRIRQQTVEQYQLQLTNDTPLSLRGRAYDVDRIRRLFWQDWPAPPRVWPRIRTHKFLQRAFVPANETE